MSDTVKQSHLVPKCYLKNFAINNKIVAFNKLTNKILVNQNISEIATQNRFYDLNEEDINDLSEIIPNISKQYIENYLSRDVEPNLEKAIDKISSLKLDSLSKKYNITIKNEDKYIFNLFLVYQLFRTRKYREVLKKIIGKNNAEKLQKNILIDNLLLQNIARGLIDYEWILYINTTDIDYITSDNPVIIYDSTKIKLIRMPIPCKGSFQILYPLTRKLLLSISDIQINSININSICDCIEMDNCFEISFINKLHYDNSFMFQYSSDSNSTIEDFIPKLHNANYSDFYELSTLQKELFDMVNSKNRDMNRIDEIDKRIKEITLKYI